MTVKLCSMLQKKGHCCIPTSFDSWTRQYFIVSGIQQKNFLIESNGYLIMEASTSPTTLARTAKCGDLRCVQHHRTRLRAMAPPKRSSKHLNETMCTPTNCQMP